MCILPAPIYTDTMYRIFSKLKSELSNLKVDLDNVKQDGTKMKKVNIKKKNIKLKKNKMKMVIARCPLGRAGKGGSNESFSEDQDEVVGDTEDQVEQFDRDTDNKSDKSSTGK